MYVITAHQRHRRTDGQTDRQTDVKRSHDRYIAKACSGNEVLSTDALSLCARTKIMKLPVCQVL